MKKAAVTVGGAALKLDLRPELQRSEIEEEMKRAIVMKREFEEAEKKYGTEEVYRTVTGKLDTSIVDPLPWHEHEAVIASVEEALAAGNFHRAVRLYENTSASEFYKSIGVRRGKEKKEVLKFSLDGVRKDVYETAARTVGKVLRSLGFDLTRLPMGFKLRISDREVGENRAGFYQGQEVTIRTTHSNGATYDQQTLEKLIWHEFAHGFDLDLNPKIYEYITPEQMVELYTMRGRAIADLQPRYPGYIELMLMPVADRRAHLRDLPFMEYPLLKWASLGEYPLVGESFPSYLLPYKWFTDSLPPKSGLIVENVGNIKQLVDKNPKWINQAKAKSPFWKKVFEEVIEPNLGYLDFVDVYGNIGGVDGPLNQSGQIKALIKIANLYLAMELYEHGLDNLPQEVRGLPSNRIKEANTTALNLLWMCHSELLAEAMAYLGGQELADPEKVGPNESLDSTQSKPVVKYYRQVVEALKAS